MSEIYLNREIKTKERILAGLKFFLIGLSGEAIFILFLYLIIYSPVFRLQEIKILNEEQLGANDIFKKEILDFLKIKIFHQSFISQILTMDNILIWPIKIQNDLNFFYEIKSISIQKDYFHRKIEIIIDKRQPLGLWCVIKKNNCFWFDDDGIVFKKYLFSEGVLILKISDYTLREIGLGSRILDLKSVLILKEIFNFLKSNNLNIQEIRLENVDLKELIIKTDGPDIYLSLNFPPPDIVDLIEDLKNNQIFYKLKYLDLRIENRVYYQ